MPIEVICTNCNKTSFLPNSPLFRLIVMVCGHCGNTMTLYKAEIVEKEVPPKMTIDDIKKDIENDIITRITKKQKEFMSKNITEEDIKRLKQALDDSNDVQEFIDGLE